MSDPQTDSFSLPQSWLRPYVAVSLLRAPADIGPYKKAEDHLIGLLETAIRDRRSNDDRLRRVIPVKKTTHGGWRISGFVYLQVSAPLWLKEEQAEESKKTTETAASFFKEFKAAKDQKAALQNMGDFVQDPEPLRLLSGAAHDEKTPDDAILVLRQLCTLLLSATPENRPAMLERYRAIQATYPDVLKPLPGLFETMLREWNEGIRIRDSRYHRALVCVREKYAAIACTDGRVRQGLRTRLLTDRAARPDGRSLFEEIPEDVLAGAFLRGHARQTWLEGLHAPVVNKASAKTLLGPDLRSALDPFGDQTFRLAGALSSMEENAPGDFTAGLPDDSPLKKLSAHDAIGKADQTKKKRVIGISFDRGVVWTGASTDMGIFLHRLEELCALAEKAEAELLTKPNQGFRQQGYQTLLVPERKIQADALGNVVHFDLPLSLPGENIDTSDEEPEVQAANDAWLRFGDFRITGSDTKCAYVDAFYRGAAVANIRVQPRISSDGVADLEITIVSKLGPDDEARVLLDRVLSSLRSRATLWFDQGYAIRRQRIFKLNFRDVKFEEWTWLPFRHAKTEYALSEEKPFKMVGQDKVPIPLNVHTWDGRSLFDYVVRNAENLFGFGPGSFLLSDDGSKEIADFIYIDEKKERVVLVHAKGASDSVKRDIAPGMYELVLQQAVKNAQFLDLERLASALDSKLKTAAAALTWEGDGKGKTGNRAGALKALWACLEKMDTNLGSFAFV